MRCLIALLVLVTCVVADSTTEVSTSTLETTTISDEKSESNSTAQPCSFEECYGNNNTISTKIKSLSICTCNLQVNWCDINCCCDPDCTSSDKLIFDYCNVDQNRYVDDRYCNYIQHIYINNTPFEWVVNQKGFFCVISNNLPIAHLVQKDKVLSTIEVFSTSTIWLPPPSPRIRSTQKGYIYGNSLLIVNANSSLLEPLRLPTSLLSRTCLTKQEVSFLKDFKKQCRQTDLSDSNSLLSFSTYFRDIRVVRNPSLFNTSRLQCPKNVCLELEAQLCTDETWTNCELLNRTKQWDYRCVFNLKSGTNHCQNAVKSLLYRIHHNGTQGIIRVQVLAVLTNFTESFTDKAGGSFTQHFSVEFIWINRTRSKVLSGNPGYLFGRPVLMATKISKTNNLSVIERNVSLFAEFGYNLMSKHYFMMIFNVTNSTCRHIQSAILDKWQVVWHQNHTALFGMFGNSSTDEPTNWGQVVYKTLPVTLINSAKDILTPKTLSCNLATLLDIQVFYSRVTLANGQLRNQNKILSVGYTFAEPLNKTFWRTNNASLKVSLELVVRVSFHDVTAGQTRKFADPPTFDVTLPYDFFYPFVKMGNSSSNKCHSVVLIFVITSVYNVFS